MYITRQNQDSITASFQTAFISALLGSRRVGKSTLVKQFSENYRNEPWVFLNMEILEERTRVENGELNNLIEEYVQRPLSPGHKIWVAIDEAQKCPALFEQVKTLYDKYKDQNAIKFILTGSGFLSLHQLSAESLAGRIELFYLREFNLQETLALQYHKPTPLNSLFDIACDQQNWKTLEDHINLVSPLKNLLEKCLTEQLCWGGLPEALQKNVVGDRRIYLRNYLQTYLEKDIRAITSITDLKLYHKLLDIIAEQTGSVRQDKNIIDALDCSRDTLKKYRGFLLATLVYHEIYPYIGRSLKRLIKSPKGYLLNNGLISYLTGIDDIKILQRTGLIGHRFENWFLKELQIWLDRETKRSEIYYWRTASGIEVDFVVEKKPLVFPFEVTYSTQIQTRKVKNLTTFMQHERNATIGYYVYLGRYHFDPIQRICYLPAWAIG